MVIATKIDIYYCSNTSSLCLPAVQTYRVAGGHVKWHF